jgi:hypothetical protein
LEEASSKGFLKLVEAVEPVGALRWRQRGESVDGGVVDLRAFEGHAVQVKGRVDIHRVWLSLRDNVPLRPGRLAASGCRPEDKDEDEDECVAAERVHDFAPISLDRLFTGEDHGCDGEATLRRWALPVVER